MELSNYTTDELLQFYSNANVTCGSGGHYKATSNSAARKEYADELKNRGIIVPSDLSEILDKNFVSNTEIPKGVFNGVGSF